MGWAVLLGLASLVKLGVTTGAALWPLRGSLFHLKHLSGVVHLYSIKASNLDVLLGSYVHTLLLLLLLSQVWRPRRTALGRVIFYPPYTKVLGLPRAVGRGQLAPSVRLRASPPHA